MTSHACNSPSADDSPPELDVSQASAARIYDFYLGGKDNFAADRAVARTVLAEAPGSGALAWANRQWASRAATLMCQERVSVLVDVGTGLPTAPSVQEVGGRHGVPVVGADRDPIVLAHYRALQPGESPVVAADARQPGDMLAKLHHAGVDFSRPVGLIFGAVWHFAPGDITSVLAAYRDALAPGSLLAISQCLKSGPTDDACTQAYRTAGVPLQPRTADEIRDLFGVFELLEPGLVDVQSWRPNGPAGADTTLRIVCGVARKTDRDTELAELRRRYEDGASVRQLAASLGCSHGKVYALLQAAGTRMRPRHRSRVDSATRARATTRTGQVQW